MSNPSFHNILSEKFRFEPTPSQAKGFEKIGIKSITELANADYETLPDVPYLKGSLKKKRAVLQARSYLNNEIFNIPFLFLLNIYRD